MSAGAKERKAAAKSLRVLLILTTWQQRSILLDVEGEAVRQQRKQHIKRRKKKERSREERKTLGLAWFSSELFR